MDLTPVDDLKKQSFAQRLAAFVHRHRLIRFIELATLGLMIAVATTTYFVVRASDPIEGLLSPPLVALLLVANLVPAIALIVLIGRRIARGRAVRSPVGGDGRLHVRLVAIFSLLASVPMLLVVIFTSLLFQYGVQFWFSQRASSMFENAAVLAQTMYDEKLHEVQDETEYMARDLRDFLTNSAIEDPKFGEFFGRQVYYRKLSEGTIVVVSPKNGVQALVLVNPYQQPLEKRITPESLAWLKQGHKSWVHNSGDRIEVLVPLPVQGTTEDVYLYAARVADPLMLSQTERAAAVLKDYQALIAKSRSLQLRFNAALLLISLLIVGAAVWIALRVADLLVRPVGKLVEAARQVTAGNLATRVETPLARDELGTLATAFNRMTQRLEAQTGALVTANSQLDDRRAFIEAVLSSVTAGIISVDEEGIIRLINRSALQILGSGEEQPIGMALSAILPELAETLAGEERTAIVEVGTEAGPRTLAVQIVQDATGHVLTFDDITERLLDQRRAAWSDVARRIAHEIKNPLTPIQLAAERLQRRFGKEIQSDPTVFGTLTSTIVRQVSDLRRMVDEFSSFARMPKPVFRSESISDIARHSLFLHEVAHPEISFDFESRLEKDELVCDRRQMGQALTNISKNAVEAIEQRIERGDATRGAVRMTIDAPSEGCVRIRVNDNGVGLPPERARIVEPYMTTRARGTGLGLAIVSKIIEDHFGEIAFSDADGGGTVVTITLDAERLGKLLEHQEEGRMASAYGA